MILNQPDFFARSATLNGAITGTDTQITLSGLSTRFTDAVAAGTVRYPVGPFRISDDDGFELIAITGHVSGTTFDVERGIQGTTAEAWADGTAVRAVVTRGQTYSRTIANTHFIPDRHLTFADDFQRSDRLLDGDNGWQSVAGGDYYIEDGVLRGSAGFAIQSGIQHRQMIKTFFSKSSTGDPVGLVIAYQDSSNYITYEDHPSAGTTDHRLRMTLDGTTTTLRSLVIDNSENGRQWSGFMLSQIANLGGVSRFIGSWMESPLAHNMLGDPRGIITGSIGAGVMLRNTSDYVASLNIYSY